MTAIQASGRIHPTKHLLCATHSLKFRESMILKKNEKAIVLIPLTVPQNEANLCFNEHAGC